MPKVSSQSSKAIKSAFGMESGIAKIVDAKFVIDQFRTKDGTVALTYMGMKMDYVKSDETGEVEDPENVMEQVFIIQIPKDGDVGNLKFVPGNIKSGTDNDPEELEREVGVAGNTYCGDSMPFADADWIEFCHSLEVKGFKPEINDQSFAPNYIGLVFKFHAENKALRPGQVVKEGKKPQTKWVVDQIFVRPYESAGKTKGATKNAPKSSTASTSKSTETSSAGSTNGSDATGEMFQAALAKLINNPVTATKGVSKSLENGGAKLADFYRGVANELAMTKLENGKGIPPSEQRLVLANLKNYSEEDGGWIELNSGGLVFVDREEGVVTKA